MQSTKLSLKLEKFAYFHSVRRFISNQFVPKHQPVDPNDVNRLENFLRDKQNVLVLTGAGISTESGSCNSMNPNMYNIWNLSTFIKLSYNFLQEFLIIVPKVLVCMRGKIHQNQSNIWSLFDRQKCVDGIGHEISLHGRTFRIFNQMKHTKHWLGYSATDKLVR